MTSGVSSPFVGDGLWMWGTLLILICGLITVYFALVRVSLRYDPQAKQAGHRWYLRVAVVVLCLAWVVPMDIFGMNFSFSVHMTQHLLLSLAVPPLLLLSMPNWCWRTFSMYLGSTWFGRVALPFVASALFNATIWVWHAPPLFQAMMQYEGLHALVDVIYLATGLLFWFPLLASTQQEGYTLPLGGKLAYLFFSDMPMMLIGAGLTFSGPLYVMPMMMGGKEQLMTVTPLDQQLGGLMMWVVGSLFFIVVVSILFLRWMMKQERMERNAERLLDDDSDGEDEEDEQDEEETSLPIMKEQVWRTSLKNNVI